MLTDLVEQFISSTESGLEFEDSSPSDNSGQNSTHVPWQLVECWEMELLTGYACIDDLWVDAHQLLSWSQP